MYFLKVKGLDVERMESWLNKATEIQRDDPVFSFICAWIAFNYFYTTFSRGITHGDEFKKWADGQDMVKFGQPVGNYGDRRQLEFFLKDTSIKKFMNSFHRDSIFNEKIDLPVKNMFNPAILVPAGVHQRDGGHSWQNISDEQTFEALYQIRNNLFHGQKTHKKENWKDVRDIELTTAAGKFMITFVSKLLESTFEYGEYLKSKGQAAQTSKPPQQMAPKDPEK